MECYDQDLAPRKRQKNGTCCVALMHCKNVGSDLNAKAL